jgi:hypothetical protein
MTSRHGLNNRPSWAIDPLRPRGIEMALGKAELFIERNRTGIVCEDMEKSNETYSSTKAFKRPSASSHCREIALR